jgi:hypothetical protein
MRRRWLAVPLLLLAAPVVAAAQTRTATLTWTAVPPLGDNQIIQRRTGHCLTGTGTWADLATVAADATSFVDTASPFPYACYRVRAVLSGQPDSANTNEDGTVLPHESSKRHGIPRR